VINDREPILYSSKKESIEEVKMEFLIGCLITDILVILKIRRIKYGRLTQNFCRWTRECRTTQKLCNEKKNKKREKREEKEREREREGKKGKEILFIKCSDMFRIYLA